MQLLDRFFIFRDVKVVIECRHVHGTHGIGHKTCSGNKQKTQTKACLLTAIGYRVTTIPIH